MFNNVNFGSGVFEQLNSFGLVNPLGLLLAITICHLHIRQTAETRSVLNPTSHSTQLENLLVNIVFDHKTFASSWFICKHLWEQTLTSSVGDQMNVSAQKVCW